MKTSLAPTIWIIVFLVAFITLALNASGESTIMEGTVIRSMGNPDKYQATDTIVFVELGDGRTVNLNLHAGAVPPAPGKSIKIRRVKRILFGEYFMLAQ